MKPEQNVNTVEAIKMLLNYSFLMQSESAESPYVYNLPYADVDGSAWYAGYVDYGRKINILNVEDNKIYPARFISRGDLALMIYKTLMVDDNGWEKYSDVSINNENVEGQDATRSSDLIVDGKTVKDLLAENGKDFSSWIVKVSGGKVLINISPNVFGGPVSYGWPVMSSAIYDLKTGTYRFLEVNGSGKVVVEDISRDSKNLLVYSYSDSGNTLMIIDAETLAPIKELAKIIDDTGDAAYSPGNDKVAWSEASFVTPEGEIMGNLVESKIMIYDMTTGEKKTFMTDNKNILRVSGWNDAGDVIYTTRLP